MASVPGTLGCPPTAMEEAGGALQGMRKREYLSGKAKPRASRKGCVVELDWTHPKEVTATKDSTELELTEKEPCDFGPAKTTGTLCG